MITGRVVYLEECDICGECCFDEYNFRLGEVIPKYTPKFVSIHGKVICDKHTVITAVDGATIFVSGQLSITT